MNLSKHPILKQGYDVIQAIEECGTNEKVTRAVVLAGVLLDEIDKLVDRLMVYSALDEMVADSIKTTLCWRCNRAYIITEKACPYCEATNANVDLEQAVAEQEAKEAEGK